MTRLLLAFLIILLFSLNSVAAVPTFTIKKLSTMGSASNNPSVSDDGCYVAFESGASVMLYDCTSDSASTIAEGYHPAISGNGEYLVFASSAALVTSDTNSSDDVYRYSRRRGELDLVSIGFDGTSGNASSFSPSVSSTGRYVAFESWASNITSGDTNNSGDIFLRDMEQPVIKNILISVSDDSIQGFHPSRNPSVSALGDRVAFHSISSNLVLNDSNGVSDIFVRDWVNGKTYRASVSAAGVEADGSSGTPAISGDGFSVAFSSYATNLVNGDSNGARDVFLKNLNTGKISLVSISTNESVGNGDSGCDDSSFSRNCLGISGSGRFVSFPSLATDLVSNDSNGYSDVFLRDLEKRSTSRISLDFAGSEGDDDSETSSISSSGRFIAFESEAALVGNHYESDLDVFLVDRGGGTTQQDLLPFVEDFSDGFANRGDSDWSVVKGGFRVSSRRYESSVAKANISLVKSLKTRPYPFSSGRIEAALEFRRNRTPRAGIIFSYKNSSKFRFVQLSPGRVIVGQKGTISGTYAFSRMRKIPRKGISRLKVNLASSGMMNVYVNNRKVCRYKFKKPVAGAVGLISLGGGAYFDDVYVVGPGGAL